MLRLSMWASTPDFAEMNFVIPVLTGTLEDVVWRAVSLGFDGLEFMPDPDRVPDPERLRAAMERAGATLLVVNSGRLSVQGYALLSRDPAQRRRSIAAFKTLLDFGGHLGARVALGAGCQGHESPGSTPVESLAITEDVFRELAEHAQRTGTVAMLEPVPFEHGYIRTTTEGAWWVRYINHPAFDLMLDIENIREVGEPMGNAIRAARGICDHAHLHDVGMWPPGILPQGEGQDWRAIAGLFREIGFEGSGAVALAPRGDADAAARTTARFLREVFG